MRFPGPFPPKARAPSCRPPPAKVGVDEAALEQRFELVDPLVSHTLEVVPLESDLAVRLVEFLGTAPGGPLRLKAGQHLADTLAAHPVSTTIGSCVARVLDPRPGDRLGDNVGQIPNLVVFGGGTHVHGQVADGLPRCLQSGQEGPRNVLDVNDGAPRCAVALYQNISSRDGPGNHVVQDEVEAKAR